MNGGEIAQQLHEILGGQYSKALIQQVLKTHAEPNNLDAVMDTLLNLNPSTIQQEPHIKSSSSSSSSSSTYSSDSEEEFETDEAVKEVEKEMEAVKEEEYRKIAQSIIEILGDMYPLEQVLQVVRTHPQSYNLEAVMDAVLDSINIRTVSDNWISNIRNSGVLDKDSSELEEFIDNDGEYKNEQEEEENKFIDEDKEEDISEQEKAIRMNISDLLATEEDRDLADQIFQTFGRRSYSIDVILCLIRHCESKSLDHLLQTLHNGVNSVELFKKDKELLDKFDPEDCVICFDSFPPQEMFKLGCEERHSYCFDCLRDHLNVNLGDGNIPTCPTPKCGHVFTEKEVLYICGRDSPLPSKYSRLLLREGLMSLENCVGCPTPGCENWLVLGDPEMKSRCECDLCNNSFCSLCKGLYHYGIDCDKVKDYTLKWMRWNENRKENSEKLQQVRELRERMEEFQKDEEWKRLHLRRCPRCSRPIEKVAGCDSMRCGRDYHGGNKQKGCGKKFNWTSALPYQPDETSNPLLLNQPLSMIQVDVKLDHGEFLPCDVCFQRIIGLRFCCLNCPCYNVCEKCEETLEHNPKHIFDVVGIEFTLQAAEKHKSLLERLRGKVLSKKASLLRTLRMLKKDEPSSSNVVVSESFD